MGIDTKLGPIINLAAKMNQRQNNETLDVDPNQTGMENFYLQNGDLYYTKSLTSREGTTTILANQASVVPICCDLYSVLSGTGTPIYTSGVTCLPVNQSFNLGNLAGISGTGFYNTPSNPPTAHDPTWNNTFTVNGITVNAGDTFKATLFTPIYVPYSGSFSLISGTFFDPPSLSGLSFSGDYGWYGSNSSGNIYSICFPNSTYNTQTISAEPVYENTLFPDREGNILLINSPNYDPFNMFCGKFIVKDGWNTPNPPEAGYDLRFRIELNRIDSALVTTDTSFTDPSGVHSIALGGNFNQVGFRPLLENYNQPLGSDSNVVPVAISDDIIINFGPASNYTTAGAVPGYPYGTDWVELPFKFSAPYRLSDNEAYYLKITYENTSGVSTRGVNTQLVINDLADVQPNMMYANETNTHTLRPQENPVIPAGSKGWLSSEVNKYCPVSYIIAETPAANVTRTAYILSGNNANPGSATPQNASYQLNTGAVWNGLSQAPSVSTTGNEFGTLFTLPSGSHVINGGYFYGNIFSGNNYTTYTTNKSQPPLAGYNVGYICNFYEVTKETNATPPTRYANIEVSKLASYTGNYVFNDPTLYQDPIHDQQVAGINVNLEYIQAIFPNAPTIYTDGTKQYMISWQFYDFATGKVYTDYGVRNTTYTSINGDIYDKFISPIAVGHDLRTVSPFANYFDRGVWTASGTQFERTADDWDFNLTAGVYSFPSGTAITSVYDYRISDRRTNRILFTQSDKVYSFEDFYPQQTLKTLWSGAAVNDLYKWSWSTFQNLAIGHEYAQYSGLVWDQIYYNPSGQSLQYHGLQPVAEPSGAQITLPSGVGINYSGIASGVSFDIILGTQLYSGGIRASAPIHFSGLTISGQNAVQLVGSFDPAKYPYDIQYTGINNGHYQYNFDVQPIGTYIFATQPSGSVFFLAPLCDKNGIALPNPIPNIDSWNTANGRNLYIYDLQFSGIDTRQVANEINYDQSYLILQTPVPKFKKTIVFKNILFGIGEPDNPSRIWFSEQLAPNIFGIDSEFYGYYDIDIDNGQELTGIEIFKDYLIIFKENSAYRASYTGQAGNPLEIFQISATIGNIGVFATVSTDYGVFGLSQFGPTLATYAGVETIGDEILPYFSKLDRTELIYAVAIHDRFRQQIYWSIASSFENKSNQKGLVYSYAEKAWGVRQDGMWNSAAAFGVGDVDNFRKLYIGDTIGQVQQINSGFYDEDIVFTGPGYSNLTRNISMEIETPWLTFGNSQNLKSLKFLKVNCETSAEIIRIDVYTDQNDTTKRYSRYLKMNVPVINRVVSLAGVGRTVKFKMYSIGKPDIIKLNSIQLGWVDFGLASNIS